VADERPRLEVRERSERGSREVKRLRKEGLIPGVLYGGGNDPVAISVHERELRRVLTGDHGLNAILDVVVGSGSATHPAILKHYQQDPLRGRLTHFDLQQVRLDRPIHAQVAIELVGTAIGAREGGVVAQSTREVEVEALPMEIPDRLELDISLLAIGDSLHISDLVVPSGVTVITDGETTVVSVTPPMRVEEPEVEEAEEGAEEGEGAPAEGEAAPEAEGEAAPAEEASEE
jgi:large subunit ribosomal protein L25